MKGNTIWFCFFLLALISACNNNPVKKEDTHATGDTIATNKMSPVPATAVIKLICKAFQKDSMDIPYYKVYLSVGGKETFIREVNNCSEIPKEEYARYDIPKEAFEARGGWYAGGGDYFYLIMRNGQPILFEGWQEEGQQDNGYHWKEKKIN